MKSEKKNSSRAAPVARMALIGATVAGGVASVSSGCLQRPVEEQEPATSNIFVEQFRQTAIDKIDLLFMIDNSASMADKQTLLQAAVPELVGRLLNPPCIDRKTGEVLESPASPSDECGLGAREFKPVEDVHLAVISSSLGGHGGNFCSPEMGTTYNATMEDNARLIATIRPDESLTTYKNLGFLAWDNRGEARDPAATNDLDVLKTDFQALVKAPGEKGCGFEAPLEAWYRFLVDPNPPKSVGVSGGSSVRVPYDEAGGEVNVIKQQRQQFLRPDSLVAIVMLTDENDCSIRDEGFGWLAATLGADPIPDGLVKGTTVCEQNPNDKCCISCLTDPWPGGCKSKDELCPAPLVREDDIANLRCFDQKRRFGIDFLYPTSRYSVGLKSPVICPDSTFPDWDCNCAFAKANDLDCEPGEPVANPLFSSGGGLPRDTSLVFLAGIVGVPHQDLATPETLGSPNELRYKNAIDLDWSLILGDPTKYVTDPANALPKDALMIETPNARTGVNPPTGAALAPPGADSPTANPVNGHEWNSQGGDLQYACIFPLETPRDCASDPDDPGCDCVPAQTGDDPLAPIVAASKPLCQDPATGNYGTDQHFAKAYPGIRELDVLRQFGDNSIVASICPKVLDPASPSYGYNPAVGAIIDRLKEKLGGRCLPRRLAPDPKTGRVPCQVVEAFASSDCPCNEPGRGKIDRSSKLAAAVIKGLEENRICGPESPDKSDCRNFCQCEVQQTEEATGLGQCLESLDEDIDPNVTGYCYVDATITDADGKPKPLGNPDLVANCPDAEKRLLRFVGKDTPRPGAVTFIACAGAAFAR